VRVSVRAGVGGLVGGWVHACVSVRAREWCGEGGRADGSEAWRKGGREGGEAGSKRELESERDRERSEREGGWGYLGPET
jgi:hypothetical protein